MELLRERERERERREGGRERKGMHRDKESRKHSETNPYLKGGQRKRHLHGRRCC